MDDIVKQAMAKWPNVPDCYGWLGLDARGNWYMRDERAQAAGAFAQNPLAKGSLLQHDKLIEFIQRNYGVDARGCWFFQNGPQRVFVALEATPWIWRLQPDGSVHTHTGLPAQVQQCGVDEHGRAYLLTDRGFGLVHTQDVAALAEWLERSDGPVQTLQAQDLPQQFGYVMNPEMLLKI